MSNLDREDLKRICLAWEVMRVLSTLAGCVFVMATGVISARNILRPQALMLLATLCVFANGVYSFGPVLEIGLYSFLGRGVGRARYILVAVTLVVLFTAASLAY